MIEIYKKPIFTAYLPSYEPDNDPDGRINLPWEEKDTIEDLNESIFNARTVFTDTIDTAYKGKLKKTSNNDKRT